MAKSKTTKVDEALPALDGGMVDVHYAFGDLTTDLHMAVGVVKFVNGVATVTPTLADALHAGGYVK